MVIILHVSLHRVSFNLVSLVSTKQGQVNRCAGCTMGGDPRQPPSTDKFLPGCFDVWTRSVSVGLDVTTTTKKRNKGQLFVGEKSALPGKSARPEKRSPALHGGG